MLFRSPSVHAVHVAQQSALRTMLARRFASDAAVGYVNLGDRLDLEDVRLSFDHMHLTVAGNQQIAEALVEPVIAAAARRQRVSS